MNRRRNSFGRICSIAFGIIGGYLLAVALGPVLLSGRNSEVINQWREVLLEFTEFTGYLRIIFVIAALAITALGIIGVIVNLGKPRTGQQWMLWGGIASLVLLITLWAGFLDLHVPIFGSTDIGSLLIWDSRWSIAHWSVSREVFHWFGGGWLKPAFAGSICLILTNLPRWWYRLR